MFTSEEPTRFGISCLGSRAMAGVLPAETLTDVHDAGGLNVLQAAEAAGYAAPGSDNDGASSDAGPKSAAERVLADVRANVAGLAAFVELHIEQARASGFSAS